MSKSDKRDGIPTSLASDESHPAAVRTDNGTTGSISTGTGSTDTATPTGARRIPNTSSARADGAPARDTLGQLERRKRPRKESGEQSGSRNSSNKNSRDRGNGGSSVGGPLGETPVYTNNNRRSRNRRNSSSSSSDSNSSSSSSSGNQTNDHIVHRGGSAVEETFAAAAAASAATVAHQSGQTIVDATSGGFNRSTTVPQEHVMNQVQMPPDPLPINPLTAAVLANNNNNAFGLWLSNNSNVTAPVPPLQPPPPPPPQFYSTSMTLGPSNGIFPQQLQPQLFPPLVDQQQQQQQQQQLALFLQQQLLGGLATVFQQQQRQPQQQPQPQQIQQPPLQPQITTAFNFMNPISPLLNFAPTIAPASANLYTQQPSLFGIPLAHVPPMSNPTNLAPATPNINNYAALAAVAAAFGLNLPPCFNFPTGGIEPNGQQQQQQQQQTQQAIPPLFGIQELLANVAAATAASANSNTNSGVSTNILPNVSQLQQLQQQWNHQSQPTPPAPPPVPPSQQPHMLYHSPPSITGQDLPATAGLLTTFSEPVATGRPPILLYIACDDDSLSEYQCMVRKQIELFEATKEDIESNAQGRNRPIVMGQVGIRCHHCNRLPPKHRARGAIYYPAKLNGIYQAAQNMASSHLGEYCQHVPTDVRAELARLRDRKSSAGGGKNYWADGVRVLGVFEDGVGLRFTASMASSVNATVSSSSV